MEAIDSAVIRSCIKQIIDAIGDNPNREGLKETPKRVARAYEEMLCGYQQDPSDVMKMFEDGACDEMVILRDIEFISFCEHHMLPFTGEATIGYVPNGKILGVSKLARLLDIYAKRLQVQERLTVQVTTALDNYLQPLGSACVIRGRHMCMSCRGVKKIGSVMVTSSLTGVFRDNASARAEFMALSR